MSEDLGRTPLAVGDRPTATRRITRARREAGAEVYLILEGIFVVEVEGAEVAEIGPGAVVGERAALADGTRTATLRARTPGRIASVPNDALDADALGSLANEHRREETRTIQHR
ncbi:MAG: cyclic nucleotide-binding domain-containing protein [Chloroflexi bacterium]|nr:cyclic nucleotide-binding domain-containing protein [Chloroflexota bacterium]